VGGKLGGHSATADGLGMHGERRRISNSSPQRGGETISGWGPRVVVIIEGVWQEPCGSP